MITTTTTTTTTTITTITIYKSNYVSRLYLSKKANVSPYTP